MRRIRLGVVGVGRGRTMIDFSEKYAACQLVAICDSWAEGLERAKREINDPDVAYYTDFEQFLAHDMDAVMLANYATEHAPMAIRCLESGRHVLSEVLPVQNMKEAVALIEAVERTGRVYAYAENYCFMPAPREMRRLYQAGKLGTFEYGEGEYLHNCESIWADITQGNPVHWRNLMYANFYCTHSIGPLIHITGQRPVRVTGFELPYNARHARMGALGGPIAVEMITLESGAVIKSLHGTGCAKNSIWYSVLGSRGAMESQREIGEAGDVSKLYCNLDDYEGENFPHVSCVSPRDKDWPIARHFGHGGSDYYCLKNFIDYLQGDRTADIISVYEALDMFLPGLLGYRSVLAGGAPQEIPDLRDAAQRERFRQDTACADPQAAGEMLLPSYSLGNPQVPREIYDGLREKWEKKQAGEKR